jgi:hypothetical protein
MPLERKKYLFDMQQAALRIVDATQFKSLPHPPANPNGPPIPALSAASSCASISS